MCYRIGIANTLQEVVMLSIDARTAAARATSVVVIAEQMAEKTAEEAQMTEGSAEAR
jgi:hypothetical protein